MIQSNPIYKHVRCCICSSRTNRFHRLPTLSTNEEKLLRYAHWVNFAALENVYNKLRYYWICENHFEDNAFCNHLKLKLLRTAVPTLNPPIYNGPPTEDGSPPGPTESKDDTLTKIFNEIIDRQGRNEPIKRRRKFYDFINTSTGRTDSETINEKEENGPRNEIQSDHQVRKVLKEDSKQASVSNDADRLPMVQVEVSSQNVYLKTPTKSTEKSDCIEKDKSILTSPPCTPRKRPLILKKSPTSYKSISLKSSSSVIRSSSDLLKILSNDDSSVELLSDLDGCPTNSEYKSTPIGVIEKISNFNNTKPTVVGHSSENPNSTIVIDNIESIIEVPSDVEESSVKENICQVATSLPSISDSSSNKKNEESDILSTAINESDVLFSDLSLMDEAVVNCDTENEQNQSKYVKKQSASRKKYYDPVLIDSVLNKMKLKKNGPVCVVTLEKKPDKLFKGFTKNKVVTLYKQQFKKNWKNKKNNQGINKNGPDVTKKTRKKRRCTCSIHCHRRLNGSKSSSPAIVNPGVGVKFEGTAVHPNVMNIDPDLADEELFNVENVFNVSTILTNVHDRSQIEQLCQMLIESIFRLKRLNVDGTMAKLQVYIAQVPESGVNKSASDEPTTVTCEIEETSTSNNEGHNIEINHDSSNSLNDQEVILSQENCDQIPSFTNLTSEKEMHLYNEIPVTNELPNQSCNNINDSNPKRKPKNVKVRLSTFHDHSYVKQEFNYLFEKPEYLVKLINVETYRCPRKTAKPLQSGVSKKEVERHKKICLKLNNRIMHLRELIQKKNKNIKSMHRKIKYLGGIVCQEKGIKRVKYPKRNENPEEKQTYPLKLSGCEDHLQGVRKDDAKMLMEVSIDQLRMDNVVAITSFDPSSFFQDAPQFKIKKAQASKTKKNTNLESFDVLYENLIEELCSNEVQY